MIAVTRGRSCFVYVSYIRCTFVQVTSSDGVGENSRRSSAALGHVAGVL